MAPEVGFQSDTDDLFRVDLDAYCTSWMVLSIPKIDFLRIQVHSLPGIGRIPDVRQQVARLRSVSANEWPRDAGSRETQRGSGWSRRGFRRVAREAGRVRRASRRSWPTVGRTGGRLAGAGRRPAGDLERAPVLAEGPPKLADRGPEAAEGRRRPARLRPGEARFIENLEGRRPPCPRLPPFRPERRPACRGGGGAGAGGVRRLGRSARLGTGCLPIVMPPRRPPFGTPDPGSRSPAA